MDRIYNWKNFSNNQYEVYLEGDLKLFEMPNHELIDSNVYPLCKSFLNSYKGFEMPSQMELKLDELFEKFNLIEEKSTFLALGCSLQQNFSDNYQIEKDDLLTDFDLEFKDFKNLLDVLEKYLFAENLKNLPEVTFRTIREGNIQIKNFFVKWDIYEALCNGFDLTKENFQVRSQELLDMTNNIIVDRYPEKVKVDFIQGIFRYLSQKEFTRANALRFIGVFFKFFQIEINNKEEEFLIFDSLEDNIKSINIKNLYHYITRPPKLFHN